MSMPTVNYEDLRRQLASKLGSNLSWIGQARLINGQPVIEVGTVDQVPDDFVAPAVRGIKFQFVATGRIRAGHLT